MERKYTFKTYNKCNVITCPLILGSIPINKLAEKSRLIVIQIAKLLTMTTISLTSFKVVNYEEITLDFLVYAINSKSRNLFCDE